MSWIKTSVGLPTNELIVNTKIDDEKGARNEQPLKKAGQLICLLESGKFTKEQINHNLKM